MKVRTSHLKLVLSVVAVLFFSTVAASARQEAGRVVVSVSAVDKEGRVVEGLKAEDLRVSVEELAHRRASLTPEEAKKLDGWEDPGLKAAIQRK